MALTSDRLPPRVRALQTLTAWLDAGRFPLGGRLPGEEHLAVDLGIARGTLREVLRQLVDQGRLAKEPNKGHVVIGSAHLADQQAVLRQTHLLLADADRQEVEIAGYSHALDRAVVRHLHEYGLHVMHIAPRLLTRDLVADLCRSRPQGVVCGFDTVKHAGAIDALLAFDRAGIPVAVASEDGRLAAVDRVIPDHRGATFELMRLLKARGRSRVLRMWTIDPPPAWLAERNAGYEAGALMNGMDSLPPCLALQPYTRSETFDAAVFEARTRFFADHLQRRLEEGAHPDAVMAITDSDAIAITAAIRRCGLQPDVDIDVVGYDDYWATCWERRLEDLPPRWTVDKGNAAIGRALVDLTLSRMKEPTLTPRLERVPGSIVTLR